MFVQCQPLQAPPDGASSVSAPINYGESQIFTCNTGFNLVGHKTLSCGSTGVLNGTSPPICQDIAECSDGSHSCSTNAQCQDTAGSYTCMCKSGYTGNGTTCNDIDECASKNHNCHSAASCTDTDGSYTCMCISGYTGNGTTCKDINECSDGTHTCNTNAQCQDTDGSYTCMCNSGYTGNGTTCNDINECVDGSHTCNTNAQCQDTDGSYTCMCNSGYIGNGTTCNDINECVDGSHTCNTNAQCQDTDGSYTCMCNSGYTGNGTTCNDINECVDGSHTCNTNAQCQDTDGSYTCMCNSGYTGNGITCNDINECVDGSHTCNTNAQCQDTDGSYTCMCNSGYTGNGTTCNDINECVDGSHTCNTNAQCQDTDGSYTCMCNSGYTGNGATCNDINECVDGSHTCNTNAQCQDTDGSYTCMCNSGYTGNGTTCNDINECVDGSHTCNTNAQCQDTDGSYTCMCNSGYTGNGTTCNDINECVDGSHTCNTNAQCQDTDGSHTCMCNSGYTGNGTTCNDINECVDGSHTCNTNAQCQDTDGSYTCMCNSGYTGNGTTCNDINECVDGSHTCNTNAQCQDTDGSHTCMCNSGYTGNGTTCNDINECVDGSHTCNTNAQCQDTDGSYTCMCNSGYTGNGTTCNDINECVDGSHTCNTNAQCQDTDGSYTCMCNSGYTGNGTTCNDINECASGMSHGCSANANCSNNAGSFQCTCNTGYNGDGNICRNVNECSDPVLHVCHANATCSDTPGSYLCACIQGFSGDGERCANEDECSILSHRCHQHSNCTDLSGSYACSCFPGYSGNGTQCGEIDECAGSLHDCHGNASCTNTNGSFRCNCRSGFSGNGTACRNVDECLSTAAPGVCHRNASCSDVMGSYLCTCVQGYTGSGWQCDNIDECAGASGADHNCHGNATCTDTAGSFACACGIGFSGNGTECSDVDECAGAGHSCHGNALCRNAEGGYVCECRAGYSGNGTACWNVNECLMSTTATAATATANVPMGTAQPAGPCHPDQAMCRDTDGSYHCQCQPGFSGNGVQCANVNECELGVHTCSVGRFCIDTMGGYGCGCVQGVVDNATTCAGSQNTGKNSGSASVRQPLIIAAGAALLIIIVIAFFAFNRRKAKSRGLGNLDGPGVGVGGGPASSSHRGSKVDEKTLKIIGNSVHYWHASDNEGKAESCNTPTQKTPLKYSASGFSAAGSDTDSESQIVQGRKNTFSMPDVFSSAVKQSNSRMLSSSSQWGGDMDATQEYPTDIPELLLDPDNFSLPGGAALADSYMNMEPAAKKDLENRHSVLTCSDSLPFYDQAPSHGNCKRSTTDNKSQLRCENHYGSLSALRRDQPFATDTGNKHYYSNVSNQHGGNPGSSSSPWQPDIDSSMTKMKQAEGEEMASAGGVGLGGRRHMTICGVSEVHGQVTGTGNEPRYAKGFRRKQARNSAPDGSESNAGYSRPRPRSKTSSAGSSKGLSDSLSDQALSGLPPGSDDCYSAVHKKPLTNRQSGGNRRESSDSSVAKQIYATPNTKRHSLGAPHSVLTSISADLESVDQTLAGIQHSAEEGALSASPISIRTLGNQSICQSNPGNPVFVFEDQSSNRDETLQSGGGGGAEEGRRDRIPSLGYEDMHASTGRPEQLTTNGEASNVPAGTALHQKKQQRMHQQQQQKHDSSVLHPELVAKGLLQHDAGSFPSDFYDSVMDDNLSVKVRTAPVATLHTGGIGNQLFYDSITSKMVQYANTESRAPDATSDTCTYSDALERNDTCGTYSSEYDHVSGGQMYDHADGRSNHSGQQAYDHAEGGDGHGQLSADEHAYDHADGHSEVTAPGTTSSRLAVHKGTGQSQAGIVSGRKSDAMMSVASMDQHQQKQQQQHHQKQEQRSPAKASTSDRFVQMAAEDNMYDSIQQPKHNRDEKFSSVTLHQEDTYTELPAWVTTRNTDNTNQQQQHQKQRQQQQRHQKQEGNKSQFGTQNSLTKSKASGLKRLIKKGMGGTVDNDVVITSSSSDTSIDRLPEYATFSGQHGTRSGHSPRSQTNSRLPSASSGSLSSRQATGSIGAAVAAAPTSAYDDLYGKRMGGGDGKAWRDAASHDSSLASRTNSLGMSTGNDRHAEAADGDMWNEFGNGGSFSGAQTREFGVTWTEDDLTMGKEFLDKGRVSFDTTTDVTYSEADDSVAAKRHRAAATADKLHGLHKAKRCQLSTPTAAVGILGSAAASHEATTDPLVEDDDELVLEEVVVMPSSPKIGVAEIRSAHDFSQDCGREVTIGHAKKLGPKLSAPSSGAHPVVPLPSSGGTTSGFSHTWKKLLGKD
ncbi:uncharacterized protein LOC135826830 [Sycon ciliatum]|uniref:uncharacterized protein LOC135826830 n=1 Tax=Sycon ciliatum TaxID=27933 RepID=UPI0031F63A61